MLETTWFILWGILGAIYFVLDGFDLGLGSIMPLLAKNEMDKRVIYKDQSPYWDGNEVWLITAGGVTFAAFPTTYAVMFSSFYSALMLILFALIFRAVCLESRCFFVPIVPIYQAWVYNFFKDKVKESDVAYEEPY